MQRTLIIGYGNLDRQDDGVAWHILEQLAQKLERSFPGDPSDLIEVQGGNPVLFFTLQLTPEVAEEVAKFERVCFVDAHTGNVSEDLNIQTLLPQFQISPFTHHLTPQSCLALSQALYEEVPKALLVSVRGYEFNFSTDLSPATSILAQQAVFCIIDWLNEDFNRKERP